MSETDPNRFMPEHQPVESINCNDDIRFIDTAPGYTLTNGSMILHDVMLDSGIAVDRRLLILDEKKFFQFNGFLDYLSDNKRLTGEKVDVDTLLYRRKSYKVPSSVRPFIDDDYHAGSSWLSLGMDYHSTELGAIAAVMDNYNNGVKTKLKISSTNMQRSIIVDDFLKPEQYSLTVSPGIVEYMSGTSEDVSYLEIFKAMVFTDDLKQLVALSYLETMDEITEV